MPVEMFVSFDQTTERKFGKTLVSFGLTLACSHGVITPKNATAHKGKGRKSGNKWSDRRQSKEQ